MLYAAFSEFVRLVHPQEGAAVATRFVADTPTITMSRLKALLTVGEAGLTAMNCTSRSAKWHSP